MNQTEADRIRKLAEAATPGPWIVRLRRPTELAAIYKNGAAIALSIPVKADCAFLGACDPQTILALLAENQRLRDALQELVACNDADAALVAELNRIPYTKDDRKYDRARTVSAELRSRIDDNAVRLPLAWSAARAALSGEQR